MGDYPFTDSAWTGHLFYGTVIIPKAAEFWQKWAILPNNRLLKPRTIDQCLPNFLQTETVIAC